MEQEDKMEVLTGKVVSRAEENVNEPAKEVELFTNPVAVHRIRLSFGAVPVVQSALAAICGGILWYMQNNGGETAAMAEEIIRRLTGA